LLVSAVLFVAILHGWLSPYTPSRWT